MRIVNLITCYRCNKKLVRPDQHNADYILLPDGEKTAIVCPECFRPDDVLIWGKHQTIPRGQRRTVGQVWLEVIKSFVKRIGL